MRISVSLALLASALLAAGCGFVTAGDKNKAGVAALRKYGCGSCHTISGVSGANGLVGPSLTDLGNRRYVAGELSNTRDNLVHWIQHPQSVNPRTAMPELGVTLQDANDIASLLYSSK